jgi:O-antigen ligase
LDLPQNNNSWAENLYSVGLLFYAFICNFSISLSQFSLSLALIGAIVLWKHGRLKIRKNTIFNTFAFFTFAGFLSVFQAEEKIKAIIELKKFFLFLVFLLPLVPNINEKFRTILLRVFILSSTIVAFSSLFDFIRGHTVTDRVKGFFSISITFGECQALALILVISILISEISSLRERILIFFSFLTISGSLLVNMTRGAWLGAFAGVVYLFYKFPKKMLLVLLVPSVFFIPVIYFNPAIKDRIESLSIKQNLENLQQSLGGEFKSGGLRSNFERLNIWTRGFKIVEEQPFFGVGMNNVKKKFLRLATDFEKKNRYLIYGHQHNNFMQIFAMTGFVGLCGFFVFLVSFFRFLLRKISYLEQNHKYFAAGAVAIFLVFIFTGLTEYSWADEEVAMMAFFFTGLLTNQTSISQM